MTTTTARIGTLAALLVLAHAAGAQEAPPAEPAAAEDPLDPASCATMSGHTAVYKAWVIARTDAEKSGRLDTKTAQELAGWLIAMDSWMIQSNEVRRHCEMLIEVRKQHGF